MMVWIEYFYGVAGLNIPAFKLLDLLPSSEWFSALRVKFEPHLFKIKDDLCHILLHPRDR